MQHILKKFLFSGFVVLVMFAFPISVTAEQKGAVVKQVCLSSFGMGWKTSEEGKSQLLSLAKREAISELFGDMVRAESRIEDFQLKKDEVDIVSAGVVRIDGVPEYFNGPGFGEACIRVTAYVSDEDRARFRPTKVTKKACVGDPKLSAEAMKKSAEKTARLQAVTDYEPRLDGAPEDVILSLLHEASIVEGGFLPGGTTYCATVSGKIVPVEATTVSKRGGSVPKQPSSGNTTPSASSVSSDPVLPVLAAVEIGNITVKISKCDLVASSTVACDFSISSRSNEETRLFVYGIGKTGFDEDRADLVDSKGERILLSEVTLGKKKVSGRFIELEQPLSSKFGSVLGTLRFSDTITVINPNGEVSIRLFISNGKVGEKKEVKFTNIHLNAFNRQ